MKTEYKILIIEPSDIVTIGVINSTDLKNMNIVFTSVYSLPEALDFPVHKKFNLILANPLVFNNCLNALNKFLSRFNQTPVIGLITAFYNRDICTRFTDCIYLNDNRAMLISIIKKHLSQKNTNNTDNEQTSLTEREKDILKLLVVGKANKEIADKLFISIHTVISHRKNITAKLGIKSAAALAIYAVANNIIDINNSMTLIK